MKIAVRVTYPETGKYDWFEALKNYKEIGRIEVAFYFPKSFLEKVSVESVVAPFKKLGIAASSIHLAHARVTEPQIFESVLRKSITIAGELNCDTLVVHPSFGKLDDAKSFIDNMVDPILDENGIFLCWETFESKRRILSGIDGIANFCSTKIWHRACYDFSHIHKPQEEVIREIEENFDFIRVFHVSNRIAEKRKQHLPLFYSQDKTDLNFHQIFKFLVQKEFAGNIVLEYLPEYRNYVKSDAQFLIENFTSKKIFT
ncbi:hypothetical protein AUJ66_07595 [Candidatus Desantisbacteria bacterium CG1_02_38_46]|uniref:Xylose isomerase-like TIM barrel domain-containing protein n=3 Tax=unclassified Candidatus Desantisiibacteriota TaxID=3106372 RepID=A0A2H9PAA1_9BACT|nr:MAG: hypothetical protein AUJ66_07595 [Candidatus Desantisbacteria bacterium CG1_02_38_46]PIU51575.1 MAG: hypothetical protein COS91_03730 [Candidatus Desantisbacteria bacterium CG07_land_8_20_14_0_80_39_15]PIZ15312.1 MAG: hypothetical protein COY51_05600 [Candidatus Desantisbacteria bacterium CG_4_10_14_0_8_um_filter_39_17]